MKIAVIDLGTNTCNLLVAEINSTNYKILHQSKELVRLGDNNIKSDEISQEATKRVLQSFSKHLEIINRFQVDKTRAVATSAVRSAKNKIQFLEQIGEKSGCVVKIVSGEKEAELIFKGVLLAFDRIKTPAVILDIGGGSNELILAKDKTIIWKESRPTGMSRVIHRFSISDPIKPVEIKQLEDYFSTEHLEAFKKCKAENVKTLIGCSGTFDTIADMLDQVNPGEKQRTTKPISLDEFYTVYKKIIPSSKKKRLCMKGMDVVRVDLIVPAVILIDQLIVNAKLKNIIQTDFALKEGILYEMMENRV